jgi:hypothetical protein
MQHNDRNESKTETKDHPNRGFAPRKTVKPEKKPENNYLCALYNTLNLPIKCVTVIMRIHAKCLSSRSLE